MLTKERVIEILEKADVLLKGHFLLTSGRHSNQYMQCAQLLQYPEYAEEISKGLADNFREDNIDVVIGPAMGGIIISYEIARQLKVKNLFAERENGKMVLRRGFSIPKGARVLIAEDVITTGGSVREVMDIVKEQGAEVAGVAVLVDRSNGTIDFGTKLAAALTTEVISYDPAECPICKEGKLPAIKPGSRKTI
ncbi:orotate phosphoribosyltransferase [Serpentinicella sp. ANB-PHB4]|uniref:orotate phosphoribosyltransferase n=1 Tax=Serpentinicella sp. ANB-PHB4 TaxID=3074076 RepID=UPI00285A1E41|nr:orotate phosphoribosyltransferase [Serpentinicella sp. ANB-PHB4]MDR5659324.1 orotate phosphoribosyltransferase [Serpentinicella sp. ANB-PHB4]